MNLCQRSKLPVLVSKPTLLEFVLSSFGGILRNSFESLGKRDSYSLFQCMFGITGKKEQVGIPFPLAIVR